MIDIADRLAAILGEMKELGLENETQSAQPKLIAVSKKQPVSAIDQAFAAGQIDFGESYVQEALPKIQAMSKKPLRWHFIGPVQSNKCRAIAENFDWVHSIDRLKIAERLSSFRPIDAPPLSVLLQVNIDDDHSKAGVAVDQAYAIAASMTQFPNIRLRGLMTILRADTSSAEQANSFASLRTLKNALARDLHNTTAGEADCFSELSMGMSADWRIAAAQGATMLRIGTAIFGPRSS